MLSPADRELVLEVLHDSRYDEFAATRSGQAIAADPKVGEPALDVGPAAGRRGAVAGAAGGRPSGPPFTALIATGRTPAATSQALFKRLTAAHTARMAAVGLNN